MADRLRPEWVALEAALVELARWAKEPQPPGALITHLGGGTGASEVGGGLVVDVAPGGEHTARPYRNQRDVGGNDAVVVFQLGYTVDTSDMSYDEAKQYAAPPFTEPEWDAIGQLLTTCGLPWVDRWNGPGCTTGSYQLGPGTMHPTITTAVARYSDDCCPTHRVFSKDDCPDCQVWVAGYDRTVPPNWPQVTVGQPAAPEPTIGDRNLQAVLAAITAARPRMLDLGVHDAMVVPGRRGRVEDGDYVDEEGLAVAIPAEVYLRLVQLAAAADAVGLREGDT